MARLGLGVSAAERHQMGALPQHFADMFGWEALADAVASVVRTLTHEERATARIYVQNYGEAGALEYYGPSRGLPPVIAGHNAYWHWGPGADTGGVLIIVGGDAQRSPARVHGRPRRWAHIVRPVHAVRARPADLRRTRPAASRFTRSGLPRSISIDGHDGGPVTAGWDTPAPYRLGESGSRPS